MRGGRGGGFRRRLDGAGVGEPVGGAAGFDDLPGERQPVDDGSAQPRIGECLCPGREWLVGGDRDGRTFFAFGENLKQQFRTTPVQLKVSQFIDQDQIDAAVAVGQLGQLLVVGGFDQFVDQLAGQGVADPVAGFGGQGCPRR